MNKVERDMLIDQLQVATRCALMLQGADEAGAGTDSDWAQITEAKLANALVCIANYAEKVNA